MTTHRRNSYFYAGGDIRLKYCPQFFTPPCIHALVMALSQVPFGFGRAHVTCFGQQHMGRSDSMPVPSLGLKKHYIFPLAFLHLYHFDEKNMPWLAH